MPQRRAAQRVGKKCSDHGVSFEHKNGESGGSKQEGPEAFELSDAWLQDGTPVAPDALTFKLNTLADRRHSGSHYWIDSGSVYLK